MRFLMFAVLCIVAWMCVTGCATKIISRSFEPTAEEIASTINSYVGKPFVTLLKTHPEFARFTNERIPDGSGGSIYQVHIGGIIQTTVYRVNSLANVLEGTPPTSHTEEVVSKMYYDVVFYVDATGILTQTSSKVVNQVFAVNPAYPVQSKSTRTPNTTRGKHFPPRR